MGAWLRFLLCSFTPKADDFGKKPAQSGCASFSNNLYSFINKDKHELNLYQILLPNEKDSDISGVLLKYLHFMSRKSNISKRESRKAIFSKSGSVHKSEGLNIQDIIWVNILEQF